MILISNLSYVLFTKRGMGMVLGNLKGCIVLQIIFQHFYKKRKFLFF